MRLRRQHISISAARIELRGPVTLHPLQGLLARVDPSLDPAEAAMPLTRLPGVGLPTPVPVPNLQRLYFKVSLHAQ